MSTAADTPRSVDLLNRKVLWVLSLSVFASTLGQGLVVPLLPGYALSMGASGFVIGLIFGMFSISRSLSLPYFGRLSDLKGRKPFITTGLFFYLCASLAFIFFNDIVSLIVIRFLQGISSAMILPVAQAYAAEISPKGREGTIMSFLNIAMYSGLRVGPFFGGVIKDHFGIIASFGAMGLVCFLGLVLCAVFLPSVDSEWQFHQRALPLSALNLLGDHNVIGMFLVRFGYIFCIGVLWAFLPLIAETEYGLSSSFIGFLMSVIVFSSAILSAPVGVLSDRMSKRLLLTIGGCLSTAGILSLFWSSSHYQLFFVVALVGIGGGFLTPSTTAMSAVIGKKHQSLGSVMSILTMGQSMGMFVGPLVAGLIIDFFSTKPAFLFGGITFFVLLLISLFLTRNYAQYERA